MPNYFIPLQPDHIYHLQSWANGDEKLFRDGENYRFFIEKFIKYASPVAEIYAYSLQPDHFDFIVHIRNNASIEKHFNFLKPKLKYDPSKSSTFIMKCFSNMLNSYAKSFNKLYQRRGSVFIDYIRRLEIITKEDLCNSIVQIHKNSLNLGQCRRIQQWRWSSFRSILYNIPSLVSTKKVLRIFGGRQKFLMHHKAAKKRQLIHF